MIDSKRVFVVSELYYPEETSTGYFMTKIAEGLAKHFQVISLCGQPSYAARGVRAPWRENHNGVEIHRFPSTTLNKDNLLFRLINIASINFSSFLSAIKLVNQGDVVLVVTNPPTLPYIIMLASRIVGAKFILRVDDVYPEILSSTGLLEKDSVIYSLLSRISSSMYRRAEKIIVLGRDMRSLLANKTSTAGRLRVIQNWGEIDTIKPAPKHTNELLIELGLANKFVIQYAGNMGKPHDLETIIEAAKRLSGDNDLHFLFIGSGVKRKWLEDQVRLFRLDNVTILDSRPRSDQIIFLNACDIAVSALVADMYGISVPSRIYNIMAAGKPVIAICEKNSELESLISEDKTGWAVRPGETDRFIKCIYAAKEDPEGLAEMGSRAREKVEQKYSPQTIISQYKEVIDEIHGCRS